MNGIKIWDFSIQDDILLKDGHSFNLIHKLKNQPFEENITMTWD